ncbi:MAG: hypothetical protein AAGA56_14275 [Myxococcota bacterium]
MNWIFRGFSLLAALLFVVALGLMWNRNLDEGLTVFCVAAAVATFVVWRLLRGDASVPPKDRAIEPEDHLRRK